MRCRNASNPRFAARTWGAWISLLGTPSLNRQRLKSREQVVVLAFQNSYGNWQREAARTGAAGVEVEDAIGPGNFRLVGVAENDGGNACGVRMQVEVLSRMDQVEELSREFDGRCGRQCAADAIVVDIAANCGERRDFSQGVENGVVADIACVEDVGTTGERV